MEQKQTETTDNIVRETISLAVKACAIVALTLLLVSMVRSHADDIDDSFHAVRPGNELQVLN